MKECQCLNCGASESNFPLIKLQYNGGQIYICPQCIPVLIHKTELITAKLQESVENQPKTLK